MIEPEVHGVDVGGPEYHVHVLPPALDVIGLRGLGYLYC